MQDIKFEIIQKMQNYACQEGITSFYYSDGALQQITDTINEKHLSALIVGATFLREYELMIEIIPEIHLEDSSHVTAIASTYLKHLYNNKHDAIRFFKNQQQLLKEFSTKNKEIYYYACIIMDKDFYLIEDVFKNVLKHDNPLVTKKHSITYYIDYDKLVEQSEVKMFSLIKNQVMKSFSQVSQEHCYAIGVEALVLDSRSDEGLNICALSPKDEKLIDNFINVFLNTLINKKVIALDAKEITSLINYSLLKTNLKEKPSGELKKI